MSEIPPADRRPAPPRRAERRPPSAPALALGGLALVASLALSLAPRPARGGAEATGASPMPRERAQAAGRGEIVFGRGSFTRDLYLLVSDGPDEGLGRRLTDSPGVSESEPDRAPDGAALAFVAPRADGPIEATAAIYVLDLATGQSRPLSHGPDDRAPDYAPDGARIAFASVLQPGLPKQSSTVSAMDADGASIRPLIEPLSSTEALVRTPAWAPDGASLAFVVETDDLDGGELYRMDADGGRAGRLLAHPGWHDADPAFSPDGRLLAFASALRSAPGGRSEEHGIWLLDPESGIHGIWHAEPGVDLRRPAWSPDGDAVVVEAIPRGVGQPSLRVLPLRAGARLGEPLVEGAEPDWRRVPLPSTPTPGPSPTREATPTEGPTALATATPPIPPDATALPTLRPFPTLPPAEATPWPQPRPTFPLPGAEVSPSPSPSPSTSPGASPTPGATDEASPTPGTSAAAIFLPASLRDAYLAGAGEAP